MGIKAIINAYEGLRPVDWPRLVRGTSTDSVYLQLSPGGDPIVLLGKRGMASGETTPWRGGKGFELLPVGYSITLVQEQAGGIL